MVNSSADTPGGMGKSGTLRYVISQLDLSSDSANTICFSIGSGAQTITLQGAPLPPITRPVFINGTTQQGFDHSNPSPLIQINGNSSITGNGLTLAAGSQGSTIQGLSITGFQFGAGIAIELSNGDSVEGNYLGINAADGTRNPNLDGVDIFGAENNNIGGTTKAASNVIAANYGNGIALTNSSRNMILGNLIGSVNIVAPNFGNGVIIGGVTSNSNTIGFNTISGNALNGVDMASVSANGNLVEDNQISSNYNDGVLISGTSSFETTIGGTGSAANVISSNHGDGVSIIGEDVTKNLVQGNQVTGNYGDGVYIGTSTLFTTGSLVQGNQVTGNYGDGVFIGPVATSNTIGGPGAGNTISGNSGNGVQITGQHNTVQGNFIGTDSSGEIAQPNFRNGVLLIAGAGNTIGGAGGARNIISGNDGNGVQISPGGTIGQVSEPNDMVLDNYIGTNRAGNSPLANGQDGVAIIGVNPGANRYITLGGNLISGNDENGLSIASSTEIEVQGNSIGTDASGISALANKQNGVVVSNVPASAGPSSNTIGGVTAETRNTISGNGQSGIVILSSTQTLVAGNFIGTNLSGNSPLSNQQYGIWVINSDAQNSSANIIGGTTAGEGNVISSNSVGILLTLSSGTSIEGNLIGTDVTGRSAMGNGVGVLIFNASGNTVGGTVASAGNVISGNTSYGIEITGLTSTGNQVWGNVIGPGKGGTPFPARGQNVALWYQAAEPWLQQVGVFITDAVGNTVGGSAGGSGNVISGNNTGVEFSGYGSSPQSSTITNAITGNSIGVTPGKTNVGNVVGIWLNNVPSNTVGGPGQGNTISGNSQEGVYIIGAQAMGNLVQGNNISGLGPDETQYYPEKKKNSEYQFPIGIYIQDSSSNTIGGSGSGNTISSNSVGVYILGHNGSSSGNTISGNLFNSNDRYGVLLYNAPYNTVPPYSTPTRTGLASNHFAGKDIAPFREYSGPQLPPQDASLDQGSGAKPRKSTHQSNHDARPSMRRPMRPATVPVHGFQVPRGPMREPRDGVRD